MTIKILKLTSVGDQKENKNTKNRFFSSLLPLTKKKSIIGVLKTIKISEEILIIR